MKNVKRINSPAYSFFTNAIDGGNIVVVYCDIISATTGERLGHSMTVGVMLH